MKVNFLTAAIAALSLMTVATAHAQGTNNKEELSMVAPALERYREQVLLGDVWKRSGFSARRRAD